MEQCVAGGGGKSLVNDVKLGYTTQETVHWPKSSQSLSKAVCRDSEWMDEIKQFTRWVMDEIVNSHNTLNSLSLSDLSSEIEKSIATKHAP